MKTQNGGISALGLLGVVFVTLKLLGITQVALWSWWWVTAPFWGCLAVVSALGLISAAGFLLIALIERYRS